MVKYKQFLKWWLFAVVMSIGFILATNFGVFAEAYAKDFTKLSFLIVGITIVSSFWCGIETWSLGRVKSRAEKGKVFDLEESTELGWFVSDAVFQIGLIGTICGFIAMLGAFALFDVADPEQAQKMFKMMGLGLSTALYTTLAGAICGLLLKVQYFNLSQGIKRLSR